MKGYTAASADGRAIHYVDRKRWFWLLSVLYPLQPILSIGLHAATGEQGWLLFPLFLNYVVAPIIDALLHCPPDALAQSKEAALKFSGLYFSDLEKREMAHPHAMKRLTAEADEGLKSFLEKRKPSWYAG